MHNLSEDNVPFAKVCVVQVSALSFQRQRLLAILFGTQKRIKPPNDNPQMFMKLTHDSPTFPKSKKLGFPVPRND